MCTEMSGGIGKAHAFAAPFVSEDGVTSTDMERPTVDLGRERNQRRLGVVYISEDGVIRNRLAVGYIDEVVKATRNGIDSARLRRQLTSRFRE
jgi:hypothetical protein